MENKNDNAVETKTAKSVKAKSNKPSFKTRIAKLWRDFKSEFKKIVWSSKRNTFNNTVLVIVSMIVVAVVIALLDLGFAKLIAWLGKLI
ncbi:MAG: preprotein translocase subunit SecE [Clostridia bacterium]|nr:preprotein translocase subunit SecE [Clostridia bacterium]